MVRGLNRGGGDPAGYTAREVIAYLESNAETFELPIELNSHVGRPFQEDGRFVLELDGREQARVLKSLGGKPLAVLSADRDQQRGWATYQDKLAQISSNSIHRTAHGSTHSALLEDSGSSRSPRKP
jgi:hypothetical protein